MRSYSGILTAGVASAIVIAGVSVLTDAPAFASDDHVVAGGLIVTTIGKDLANPTVVAIEEVTNSEVTAVDGLAKNTHVVVLEESLTEADVNHAIKELEQRNDVVSVAPNLIMTPDVLNPIDPLYLSQFGLIDKRTKINDGISNVKVASGAFSVRADQLWRKTTGDPSVVVAVLDTGILFDHPDLQGQLLNGYDFVSQDRFDRDGQATSVDNFRDADPSDPGDWVRTEKTLIPAPMRQSTGWLTRGARGTALRLQV